ncbi:hypothetical protein F4814DRAFT_448412 [Daldinia grandis]|nr:hypothetical protein F4814DRAFT_448412 [Daldinia grandis]
MNLSNYCWYNREDILRHLHGYRSIYLYQQGRAQSIISGLPLETLVRHNVIIRIVHWIRSLEDHTIWIPHGLNGGPTTNLNQVTLEALYAKAVSDNVGIPSVYYFYSFRPFVPRGAPEPSKSEMLLDMIRSIIVQFIILFLPEETYTDLDLSPERLQGVASPRATLNEALSLLTDVRTFAFTYTHCIIEGFEKVDDNNDPSQKRDIQLVVDELSKHIPVMASNVQAGDVLVEKVIKTCFTSTISMGVFEDMVNHGLVERVSGQ